MARNSSGYIQFNRRSHILGDRRAARFALCLASLLVGAPLAAQVTLTYFDADIEAADLDTGGANNPTTFSIDAGSATQTGVVFGGGGVRKDGAGTFILEGSNTYSGGTIVLDGTLVATSASALGSGFITVGAGGTLVIGDGFTFTDRPITNEGGTVDNAASLLNNLSPAVWSTVADSTVVNRSGGVMRGAGAALRFNHAGLVVNEAGATIQSFGNDGILFTGAGGSVENAGDISGDVFGIVFFNGGSVENSGTVTGTGASAVVIDGSDGFVGNRGSGVLTGGQQGVRLLAGGAVTNESAAVITGQTGAGVEIIGAPGSLLNAGLVSGGGHGASLASGSDVTNLVGGRIEGHESGLFVRSGLVENAGEIFGSTRDGITFQFGDGVVVNIGDIQGAVFGLAFFLQGDVENHGTITGSTAVAITTGGRFWNEATGVVTPTTGLALSSTGGATDFRNAGLIAGGVQLGDFANTATLVSGGQIQGGLGLGVNAATSLSLEGAGVQLYSDAVAGITVFHGDLAKRGTGAWVLDVDFTQVASTTVEEGLLVVDAFLASDVTVASGGVLGGTGIVGGGVVVQSGGVLAPGSSPGILNLGSLSLLGGSTLQMEINGTVAGTEHDQLIVAGAAELAGNLDLVFGYVPAAGDTFTLIAAASFVFNGDPITGFDSITTNLGAALLANVVTDPTTFAITIALAQQDFAPFALTPNQLAVAENLDLFSTSGLSQDLIDVLNTLDAADLPAAFDQIAPEEIMNLIDITQANTRATRGLLANRHRDIRAGRAFSSDQPIPRNVARFADSADSADFGTGSDAGFGGFAFGQALLADFESSGTNQGYEFGGFGALVGVDRRLGQGFTIGAYSGFQRTNQDASSRADVDSTQIGLYVVRQFESDHWLSASVGGALNRYDTRRNVLGSTARGSTDGHEVGAVVGAGRDFRRGKWTIGTEVELAYSRLWIDGFTETGGLASLVIGDQEADSLRGTAGVRLSLDLAPASNGWQATPFVHAGWRHEFMDTDQSLRSAFANGAGLPFVVVREGAGRGTVVAGAGVAMAFGPRLGARLGYALEANDDYAVHRLDGGFSFRF